MDNNNAISEFACKEAQDLDHVTFDSFTYIRLLYIRPTSKTFLRA